MGLIVKWLFDNALCWESLPQKTI